MRMTPPMRRKRTPSASFLRDWLRWAVGIFEAPRTTSWLIFALAPLTPAMISSRKASSGSCSARWRAIGFDRGSSWVSCATRSSAVHDRVEVRLP